ncbi:MAG: UDP-N-acetylglucosamine 2-epimerase (hydrolyzing) [Alphaproteobacteria bacterium]|nr:UDP-N-acetylglucosamine 2-epimerase (hydrolyzing) [Alphaproteobacteria bacterium]
MTRILSVSTGRSDVGILAPIWGALAEQPEGELHILLTGMHRAPGAAEAEGVPASATVHVAGADMGGEEAAAAAEAMASISAATGRVIEETAPDVMLVVGDRLDMLPAALASLPFNLPLVHVHGGEITDGAVDDRIRHALSKLSHLHCVSSQHADTILRAMGEEDWRIKVTGSPTLDTLRAAPTVDAPEFARAVGLPCAGDDVEGFRLVTVHPETNSSDPLAPMRSVLEALRAHPGRTLFTAPNSDPGGAQLRRDVEAFCATEAAACFVDTLGPGKYASALRHATLMLGNSSSGIIEAGLFGLPVINVGDRQAGRLRGDNVVDVANDADSVAAVLARMESDPTRHTGGSPYGDGASGPRVADILANLPERQRLLDKVFPV